MPRGGKGEAAWAQKSGAHERCAVADDIVTTGRSPLSYMIAIMDMLLPTLSIGGLNGPRRGRDCYSDRVRSRQVTSTTKVAMTLVLFRYSPSRAAVGSHLTALDYDRW